MTHSYRDDTDRPFDLTDVTNAAYLAAELYGTPYAEDNLRITGATTVDEILEFVDGRLASPVTFDGVTIWNFSGHVIDEEALQEACASKLHRPYYVVPYQVNGIWAQMTQFLPEELQEAEVLVYVPADGVYYAYHNYLRDVPSQVRERFAAEQAAALFERRLLGSRRDDEHEQEDER